MRLIDEFKQFALKGSMLDMAIGLMLGAAFNGVVNSLVNDLLMPPLGLLMSNEAFTDLYINLSGGQFDSLAEAQSAGAATLNYGVFINNAISFAITALALFFLVRWFNTLTRRNEAKDEAFEAAAMKECPFCFSDIPRRATRCPHCTSQLQGS